jgi:hypothetical protein
MDKLLVHAGPLLRCIIRTWCKWQATVELPPAHAESAALGHYGLSVGRLPALWIMVEVSYYTLACSATGSRCACMVCCTNAVTNSVET